MKRIISAIVAIIVSFGAFAQNINIPLRVTVSEETGTAKVNEYLHNKLLSIVATEGIGGGEHGISHFMLAAKSFTDSKEVVGTAPTMYAMNINLTLYIVNWVDGSIFAQNSLTLKGAGQSEEKCYMNALRQINPQNARLNKMLADGERKIVAYYTAEGENIIARAKTLTTAKQFDEALFLLSSIPSVAKEPYAKAQPILTETYKQYLNYKDAKLLHKAKSVWAATQNRTGAAEAGALLAEIEPDSDCRAEAESLYESIKKRIGEEWTFVMKAYDDRVQVEKQRIEAARAIGVAYGSGQQPNTTNIFRR